MPKGRSRKKLTLMVSSTVYGIEELLNQVYALLTGFGYEVWMSHAGTVPVLPNQTALDSCLTAVEKCDLFLSIITPRYGSGVLEGELSITHQELLKSIDLNKPRWVLAHDHVVFARTLLRKLGAKNQTQREAMLKTLGFGDAESLRKLRKQEELVFDDFRVIDMYEAAIRHDLKVYAQRTGNWVQKYNTDEEVRLFATAQFSRYRDVERFLREQFAEPKDVMARATTAGGPDEVKPKPSAAKDEPPAGPDDAKPKGAGGPTS